MDISKFISKVLGAYLIIISIVMMIDINTMLTFMTGFINDPPLVFITGIFTLLLGILLVATHNIWRWDWRLIITIIAWMVLLKGISVIAVPQFIDNLILLLIKNTYIYYISATIDLFLGILLSYFGFKR